MDSNSIKSKMSIMSCLKPGIMPFCAFIFSMLLFVPQMIDTYGTEKQLVIWLVAIFWIGISIIPALILQLNYYLRDKDKRLIIDNLNESITFIEGTQIREIHFSEIENIEKIEGESFTKMLLNTYYYYRINLKSNNPLVVSCMIITKFEKKAEKLKFEFDHVFFPFIRKY